MTVVVALDGSGRDADARLLGTLYAEAVGADLRMGERVAAGPGTTAVVIAAPRRGWPARLLGHGVERRLLREAPCPLLVAPPGYAGGEAPQLRAIGCGLDDTSEAHVAWRHACTLAAAVDGVVTAISVHRPQTFAVGTAPLTGVDFGMLDERYEWNLHRELIRTVTSAPPDVCVHPVMASGSPAVVLRESTTDLDLLVLGHRRRSRVASLIAGSVTAQLLATARCPLAIVR